MNLAKLLVDKATSLGERMAIDFEGDRVSFGALYDAVRSRAAYLEGRGIRRGDRVAIQLPKCLEFIFHHLAVLSVGAVSLPLNDRFTPRELAYFLEDSGAALFMTDREGLRRAGGVVHAFGEEKAVALDGDPAAALAPAVCSSSIRFANTSEEDTAMICYTSGTTGRPKGAMLTHGNLIRNMQALNEAWAWRSDDVLLHGLPLFHIHGLVMALHGALYAGSGVVMLARFDAAQVSRNLEQSACTLFMGVPTMYRRLVEHWDAEGTVPDLSRMRAFICGSAPLAPGLFHRFQSMTGHTILERYGMTETGIIASNPLEAAGRCAGTVGIPLTGVSVRIQCTGSPDSSSHQVGEVQVKGPNVFKGYWKAPDKTAASFDDGWFRTGDLGCLDPESRDRLTLHGRAGELIISGGFNVYPREVEELLESYPGIKEAAVLGLDDPEWGERVIAVVVPEKAGSLDEQELLDYSREHLAPYKCPKKIFFQENLPRNTMGKVQKSRLTIPPSPQP